LPHTPPKPAPRSGAPFATVPAAIAIRPSAAAPRARDGCIRATSTRGSDPGLPVPAQPGAGRLRGRHEISAIPVPVSPSAATMAGVIRSPKIAQLPITPKRGARKLNAVMSDAG